MFFLGNSLNRKPPPPFLNIVSTIKRIQYYIFLRLLLVSKHDECFPPPSISSFFRSRELPVTPTTRRGRPRRQTSRERVGCWWKGWFANTPSDGRRMVSSPHLQLFMVSPVSPFVDVFFLSQTDLFPALWKWTSRPPNARMARYQGQTTRETKRHATNNQVTIL